MNASRRAARRLGATTLLLAAAVPAVDAQVAYPALQPPTVDGREFNFGVGDADYATSFLFQWREPVGRRSQLSLDAGFLDFEFGDGALLVGGQYAYQLTRANAQMPFDLLLTGGLFAAFPDQNEIFRVPIGIAAGHRFPLEGQLAITPYAHPRVAMTFCDGCGGVNDDSDVSLLFDLGVDFELNRQMALRFGVELAEDEAFGFSFAWSPRAMR